MIVTGKIRNRVLLVCLLLSLYSCQDNSLDNVCTKILYTRDKKDSIVVKKILWELTGNNRRFVISQKKGFRHVNEYDETTEYVYNGVFSLYYVLSEDTLFVYTGKLAKTPKHFHSKIVVKQIELSTRDDERLFQNKIYTSADELCDGSGK